jgi:hypothetical protein
VEYAAETAETDYGAAGRDRLLGLTPEAYAAVQAAALAALLAGVAEGDRAGFLAGYVRQTWGYGLAAGAPLGTDSLDWRVRPRFADGSVWPGRLKGRVRPAPPSPTPVRPALHVTRTAGRLGSGAGVSLRAAAGRPPVRRRRSPAAGPPRAGAARTGALRLALRVPALQEADGLALREWAMRLRQAYGPPAHGSLGQQIGVGDDPPKPRELRAPGRRG